MSSPAIRAVICKLRTVPYGREELLSLPADRRDELEGASLERIEDEIILCTIDTVSLEKLSREVLKIYQIHHPTPLIITTPDNNENLAVKHSFVFEQSISGRRPDLSEIIVYTNKDPELYHRQTEDLHRNRAKFQRRILASLHQKFVDYALGRSLQSLGFSSRKDLELFLLDLSTHKQYFPSDDSFEKHVRDMLKQRSEGASLRDADERGERNRQQEAMNQSRLPSVLNDSTSIICRLVGTNRHIMGRHITYYCQWHKIPKPVFAIGNDDMEMTYDFTLGKSNDI